MCVSKAVCVMPSAEAFMPSGPRLRGVSHVAAHEATLRMSRYCSASPSIARLFPRLGRNDIPS